MKKFAVMVLITLTVIGVAGVASAERGGSVELTAIRITHIR